MNLIIIQMLPSLARAILPSAVRVFWEKGKRFITEHFKFKKEDTQYFKKGREDHTKRSYSSNEQ